MKDTQTVLQFGFLCILLLYGKITSGCDFEAQGHCLELSESPLTYQDAITFCYENNGSLVQLEDDEFRKTVVETIKSSIYFTGSWVANTNQTLDPSAFCGVAVTESGDLGTPNLYLSSEVMDPCITNVKLPALCEISKSCTAPHADGLTLLSKAGLYKDGEKAIYQCNNGYINGKSKYQTHVIIQCNSGEWSDRLPTCSENFNIIATRRKIFDFMHFKKQSRLDIWIYEPFILKCSEKDIDGEISFAFWTKDGLYLEDRNSTTFIFTTMKNGELHITKAKVEHSGIFTCFVYTEDGEIMPLVSYEINFKDYRDCDGSFIYKRENTIEKLFLNIGDSTVLHCAESTPTTQYRWYKDNVFIFGNEQETILDDGSLLLRNVTLNSNSHYFCVNDENNPKCTATSNFKIYAVTVLPVLQEYCGIIEEDKFDSAILIQQRPRPWLISIIKFFKGKSIALCHGSLISYKTVITSASCFKEMNITEMNESHYFGIYVQFTNPYLEGKGMFEVPILSINIQGPTAGRSTDKTHKHLYISMKNNYQGIFGSTRTYYAIRSQHTDIYSIQLLSSSIGDDYRDLAIVTLKEDMQPISYKGPLRPICIKNNVDTSNQTLYHSIFQTSPYQFLSSPISIQSIDKCKDILKDQQPITHFCAEKLTTNETDIPLLPGSPLEIYENGRWYLAGVFTHFVEPYYYFSKIDSVLKNLNQDS